MRGSIFNTVLRDRLNRRGIEISERDTATLRLAEMTLRRWFEQECGNGDNWKSWAIERDEKTDRPYMVYYFHSGQTTRTRIADKEKGARDRVEKTCKRLGLYYYIQTDPRGCALWVSKDPIKDNDYTNGVSCHVDI
jgi:hypothetical protein